MNRCLELAKKGIGTTRPNPSVGAVIVCNDQIIGEGYTSPYGGSHAEVNAIKSVKNENLLKQAAMYVTLEPCSHFGKTPPCSDLIIEKEISKVVIGCIDDNPKVGGKGIERLKNNKIDVTRGVLETECKEHHKRFFTFHNKKRPYVILKWAESNDGFIAPESKEKKEPIWITNKRSRQLVHQWRAEEHAILVGANTVIEDNPSLTVRNAFGENPIRIVLDSMNQLDSNFKVFNAESKTIKINTNSPKQVLDQLHKLEIQSVIIEGGTKTLQSFINKSLWDEARVFLGSLSFLNGVKAPEFNFTAESETRIEDDILKIYRND